VSAITPEMDAYVLVRRTAQNARDAALEVSGISSLAAAHLLEVAEILEGLAGCIYPAGAPLA